MKIHKSIIVMISLGIFALTSNMANAKGGIALGATRVIYYNDAKQVSLAINNSSDDEPYLINSWVENESGSKEKNFIITPPLFVSSPKSENTLRIIYAGQTLPKDRESIYYLSVKAIPSVDKNEITKKNVLQIAILSRIKLFYRPKELSVGPSDSVKYIKLVQSSGATSISNSSPYYVTMVNIIANGKKMKNMMVAPLSSKNIDSIGNVTSFTFQTVNDYGALTPVINLTGK